jgi:HEPN domain-containing protein
LDYTVNVAEKNLEMQLYVSAAFYIHLAVEKALKVAIVSLKDEFPEKTHRLQRLYAEIEDKVQLTEEQIEFLEELTSVAVSARYEDMELTDPSEIYTKSIVEEYMQKALLIIEKLRASIQS